jgi:hypothetical protein
MRVHRPSLRLLSVLAVLVVSVAFLTLHLGSPEVRVGLPGGSQPLIELLPELWAVLTGVVVSLVAVAIAVDRSEPASVVLMLFACLAISFVAAFAACYAGMSIADPGLFNDDLSSSWNASYFAMTIFTTTGFGDIHADQDLSRAFVTMQMGFGLFILAVGLAAAVGRGPSRT